MVPSAVPEETKALRSGGALELFLKNKKLKKKKKKISVLALIEPSQRTRLSLLNVFEKPACLFNNTKLVCLTILS